MAIAGKVAITPKGEWNANTAYTKLDLVFYENASYVAIQPSTGVEPTNTSYWMLVVQSAGGADLDGIIDGSIQVGNAKTLDGHEAGYFFKNTGGTVGNGGMNPLSIKGATTTALLRFFNNANELLGYLGFINNKPVFQSNENRANEILHTGNKPTGTYTGNGSATARTIATGGIGSCVMVRKSGERGIFAIVTESGYYAKDGSNGEDAYFASGVLTIASTSNAFNTNGATYYYQVL